MPVTSRFAVLGSLLHGPPLHGYAVVQRLRGVVVDPRSIRPGMVYSALDRLADERLIEERGPMAPATPRQPRVTYGLTERGLEVYEAWLHASPSSMDDLVVRVAFARPQDVGRLVEHLTTALAACRVERRGVGATPDGASSLEATRLGLVASRSRLELAARAEWLETARRTLAGLRPAPRR